MTDTVLVTSRSFSSGRRDLAAELAAAGLAVRRGPATHELSELADTLAEAVAWIAGTGPVGADHLDAAPRLRVLARYGVGVESVDLAAARARGLVVTNTPGANSDAVADHTLALLLALLRTVTAGDRDVRAGRWQVRRGSELGGATVGVVGFGRIGQGVARRLAGFGSTLLAYDPYADRAAATAVGVEIAELADLGARCDVVTLHAPGGRCLIDQAWIDTARPGVRLVNTARADLVDETALAAALRSGRLGGYAADMLSSEGHDRPSALLAEDLADRVVITPHLGAQTTEAVDRMGGQAVADVLAVLAGRPPAHPVQKARSGTGRV